MSTYYVATTGNDAFPGTADQPFLTLQKAADETLAGDMVIVRDGTYYGPEDNTRFMIGITTGGSEGNPVIFRPENPGMVTLSGGSGTQTGYCFAFMYGASHVIVEGFIIKNFYWTAFDMNHSGYPSSYLTVQKNIICDIGRIADNGDYGRGVAYVGAKSHHISFLRNLAYNIGRTDSTQRFSKDHFFYSRSCDNIEDCGHHNTIAYNIVYGVSGAVLNIGSNDDLVANNVFAYPSQNLNPANPGGSIFIACEGIGAKRLKVINNIFTGFSPNQPFAIYRLIDYPQDYTGWEVRNNFCYGGRMWEPTTYNATAQQAVMSDNYGLTDCQFPEADPRFINGSLPAPDFRLQEDSPCINAGIPVGLTTDYYGNLIEGVPDSGVYEASDPPVPKDADIDPDLTGYLPSVSWTTVVSDVVKLSDWRYRVTLIPLDVNEPGSGTLQVGFYLADWIGHTYHIKAVNVGGRPYDVELSDELRTGTGPQIGQEGKVYRSVGNGEAPIIGAVEYNELDKRALDYKYGIDMDILWKARGDIGEVKNLLSRSVSVTFKKTYLAPPVGLGNIRVYRMAEEMPGKPVAQMVLFHSPAVTVTGFTLIIDESEPLEGIIIEYNFTQAT